MKIPQFKGGNLAAINECQTPLYMQRKTNTRSLVGLYFSELLLFVGFLLIFLNNLNVLSPGSYFGAFSWVTTAVFAIGVIINYISIPHLYFSSYRNFTKDDDFWDRETFWILPLFFFGTFFLYGSQISTAYVLLEISIAIIWGIHLTFTWSAWKNMIKNSNCSLESKHQYFVTLKYLTVYYVILMILLVLYNPLQHMFYWIRTNF